MTKRSHLLPTRRRRTDRLTSTVCVIAAITFGGGIGEAGATTFCVPTFHAACPNSGGNVSTTLATAMQSHASDGIPDTAILAPGTMTSATSVSTAGSDPLEVIGAGRTATTVTTSSTGNVFVLNLNPGTRTTTVRDLTVHVPASLLDGGGTGMQLGVNSLLLRVDLEIANTGSDGISAVSSAGTLRDVEIRPTGAGSVTDGFATGNVTPASPTTILLDRVAIRGARTAISSETKNVVVSVTQSRILDANLTGVSTTAGGRANVSNSLITTAGTATGIRVRATDTESVAFTADQVTIVNTGAIASTGLFTEVTNVANNGGASATLRNSIIRGFTEPLRRVAPTSGTIGNANLTVANTNSSAAGGNLGDGALTTNDLIDADPKFVSATDFALQAGSPSIDVASVTAPLTTDLLGLLRPRDGNGDGVARNDQGAFEFQPPTAPAVPTAPGDGTPGPAAPDNRDRISPVITKVAVRSWRFRTNGRVRMTLSEPAALTLLFTRGTGKSKRTSTITAQGTQGANAIRIPGRRLQRGRWRLTVVATDLAGNVSAPARRTLRVRR